MSLKAIPFIMLNGNAKEAIQFYEKALDAKLLFSQTMGEAPDQDENLIPEEARDRVAHAVLQVGETGLYVADVLPGEAAQSGNQLSICLTTDDAEYSKKIYELLQEGGQVKVPLTEYYFSPAYAMVTDKFDVTFQIFTKRTS
ncbi:VOC family protein [Paenibacillus jiagnxiensis]|uniref:VOC family protein n=1 Tax=Paenibacillus jiagnxiensis TaxID=3228926 RepID=UPI0033B52299